MKRSKSKGSLGILLMILLVLIAVFFFLRFYNGRLEQSKAEEVEASKIHITDLGELSSISYTNASSQKVKLSKKDDTWILKEEPEVTLDQSYFTTMESEITGLVAVREIETPDELKDYGLEEPSYTINVKDTEGTKETIYIGAASGEDYYLTTGDKEHVYTGGSSLVESLQYGIGQMIVNDTVPTVGSDQIVGAVVKTPKKIYRYTQSEEEDALSTVLGGLGSLSFDECVEYNVAEEKLATYGLDEATRKTVKIVYKDSDGEKQSFILHIGKKDDTSTYYYVQVDGSKIVNKALVDTVKNLVSPQ